MFTKTSRIAVTSLLFALANPFRVDAAIQAPIVYNAIEDFAINADADAPYYRDRRNNALAIDARRVEYRNLFAQASVNYTGQPGQFDFQITTMSEEDGEPIYRLLVNGVIVGTHRGAYIGKGSELDLAPAPHTWRDITLKPGDTISVASIAHTNGEIPEHGGTAWSRGRWQSLTVSPSGAAQQPRAYFNKHSDILVSQFDLKPDADDIHAIAALGSMFAHEDMNNTNFIAVAGTYDKQSGEYINANTLLELAFGKENFNWVDAHHHRDNAITLVSNRVKAVLAQGGKAWVQEAGQSDFTRDWLEALLSAGIHPSVIKNNVIVVQHSDWNESKTNPEALARVKALTHYQPVSDGNKPRRIFDRKNRRGPVTPMYVAEGNKWINAATSEENSFAVPKALWTLADSLIKGTEFDASYSVIPKGGVDFSDHAEIWWIFDQDHRTESVHAFWERYVTDIELDTVKPPQGRLAVVIDGNSPDPDDIGATPVMFALLQQTGLSDRLVHISHSCDLDPFRNKARYQIDPENEARRQKILHHLSGKSIELFGPFPQLRDYYNCRTHQQEATQDLVDAINNSTSDDPLWIIEAGEPDLIGYALAEANPDVTKYVHVVSHHPANDNSGDYFTWEQILEHGVTEHQIGDQNLGLQGPIHEWDWAKESNNPGMNFIWEMLAYAEQDGIVPFQTNKFDCSDAGMMYWWLTGANKGGNNFATAADITDMLTGKYTQQ